jgi:3-hydroxypropanoate dehydrogenase
METPNSTPKSERRADPEALDLIFREARTHYAWEPTPIPEDLLRQVYDLAKLGPTSLNCCPMRIVFLTTKEAKERLLPALMDSNVEKARTAPAVALFAYDTKFYEFLPKLIPHYDVKGMFEANPERAEKTAQMNGTLQAAYFIIAARALGLDCGPMGGFDPEKVNAEFFPDGRLRINFVCNLGYGKPDGIRPRLPRLEFDEACTIGEFDY